MNLDIGNLPSQFFLTFNNYETNLLFLKLTKVSNFYFLATLEFKKNVVKIFILCLEWCLHVHYVVTGCLWPIQLYLKLTNLACLLWNRYFQIFYVKSRNHESAFFGGLLKKLARKNYLSILSTKNGLNFSIILPAVVRLWPRLFNIWCFVKWERKWT